MEPKKTVERYRKQATHYFENAERSLEAGEPEKAGEFIWGSMAQAVKAVAAARGVFLRTHRQIWDSAEMLAKELGDRNIFDSFLHAHSLHTNFYECDLELKDVVRIAQDVRGTINKLLALLPTES